MKNRSRLIPSKFLGKAILPAACVTALSLTFGLLSPKPVAAADKTLVYCSEGSPENFTPAINTTGTSFDAARPVYDRLVDFERGGTKVMPALAESWKLEDGGKTIIFKLRHGVKFHAGVNGFTPSRDFNADDVLWSFNRMWKADHPYFKVSGGAYDYFNDMNMPKLLKSLSKIDDYTVKMELNLPDVTILANLAMDFAAIGSAEYADYLLKKGSPEQFDQMPVGTGAFSFVSYTKDSVIRYKANPAYWGEKSKIDNLVFAITPDPTSRFAKLKAGECHLSAYLRIDDIAEARDQKGLKVAQMAGLNIAYLSFQVQKKPLDDKRVREALTLAIDKNAIIKAVYKQAGQPAKNLIPPIMWSYNDKIKDRSYNPERAKKLLAEAGVKTPLEVDIWWMPVQRPYNPNSKQIAEMVQADWAKIGVTAKPVSFEWGEYRKRMQAGEHMTGQLGWTGDNGDPDNFFFLLACNDGKPTENNLSKWCHPEFNKLYENAKTLPKQADRIKVYERMQEIMHDEMPLFPIAHSTTYEVMVKGVANYKQSPFGSHEFRGVGLE